LGFVLNGVITENTKGYKYRYKYKYGYYGKNPYASDRRKPGIKPEAPKQETKGGANK
jgi:hypothetical protein